MAVNLENWRVRSIRHVAGQLTRRPPVIIHRTLQGRSAEDARPKLDVTAINASESD